MDMDMVSISGLTFRALEAAARELSRRGLEIEKYQIDVVTSTKKIMVLFRDPLRKRGQLGSGPNLVGLDVEIDAETLQVTSAHFSK